MQCSRQEEQPHHYQCISLRSLRVGCRGKGSHKRSATLTNLLEAVVRGGPSRRSCQWLRIVDEHGATVCSCCKAEGFLVMKTQLTTKLRGHRRNEERQSNFYFVLVAALIFLLLALLVVPQMLLQPSSDYRL
eukprot:scpid41871/ scgid19224/ 